ncbi:Transposable element Tc1 transposase [Choanephora cucurbitarum]|uniref:Transposable element Tc1 transposase n=1 Tax=Choanephora cucurbitarum TaxID=101091 RepID=A0A1C7N1B0_9FUNG|nr:Transposable element Tc1 transposase [Choanephora cucurbitarum]
MPRVTNTTKLFYLNRAGHSQREIAGLVELPLLTVNSIIAHLRHLRFYAVKHELKKFGINVCRATVIEYLEDMGFSSYYAEKKPALAPQHKQKRLKLVQKHIERHQGGLGVIRQQCQAYKEEFTVPTEKFDKGSVMLWGCFWRGGAGPLVFVDGSAKEDRTFTFQEDGATCHTAAATRAWKTRHMINEFEFWPAQSPDLNPIEPLWWALELRIESRRQTADVKETLLESWNEIGHYLLMRLVDSMNDRCQAVIDAKGGPTKY